MKLLLHSLICFFSLLGAAAAALRWESTTAELQPAPQDTAVVAHYVFRNDGPTAVTITRVKTSCECTTTRLAETHYQPGAQGVLAVTFQPRPRSGTQEKVVLVETDDASAPSTVLTLRVTIPAVLDLVPDYLTWRQDEAATPKTLAVQVLTAQPVQLQLGGTTADFTVVLTTIEPGRRYALVVTPRQTTASVKNAVTLQTDFAPHGTAFTYTAHAGVLPAAPVRPADAR